MNLYDVRAQEGRKGLASLEVSCLQVEIEGVRLDELAVASYVTSQLKHETNCFRATTHWSSL